MFEIMFYPFLALLGVSFLSGPYGCQMMWHKVACLGDTLSHGALLGLACGALIGLNEGLSLFLLSVIWGFFLWLLTKNRQNSSDTIMAFLMQISMALAILVFSFLGQNTELMHAFLGDILMIEKTDVFMIFGFDFILGIILFFCWKKWVLIAINPDLAKSSNVNVNLQQFIFFTTAGFLVAQTMSLMGALLAPAFFIIPSMAARPLSKTPEKMALISSLFAILSSFFGLFVSFQFDLPSGACIVIFCVFIYVCVVFLGAIKNLLNKYLAYSKIPE